MGSDIDKHVSHIAGQINDRGPVPRVEEISANHLAIRIDGDLYRVGVGDCIGLNLKTGQVAVASSKAAAFRKVTSPLTNSLM